MTSTQTQPQPQGLPDARPWASYGRISKRKSGDGMGAYIGIANQHAENRVYLASKVSASLEVVDYSDNLSAWDEEAFRADWEQLLTDLASGQYAGVVGWHADRYTRQPIQLEQLWKACRLGRAQLHTARGGHHTSMLQLRIEGALAAEESDQKSARQQMKHAQLARDGKWHGGPRPYGYLPGMEGINEDEAFWVEWMAQGVLAGRALNSLEKELAERGVTTATGKQWRASNIGTYLRKPLIAGLREHQGKVVGQAQWPAILDSATWEAVRTLLEKPERRTSHSQARRYLLSGVARCGDCGGKMRARSNGVRATAPSYFCKACGVSRRADYTDRRVIKEIIRRLKKISDTGALDEPQDLAADSKGALEAESAQLKANLAALGAQAVLGTIPADTLAGATQAAAERQEEIQAQLADLALVATRPSAVLKGATGPNAGTVWVGLDLDRRRAIVDLLATVTIHRAARKGAPFDPKAIQVEWK